MTAMYHPGPLLDACLIVRNEAGNLPDCLRSLRSLGGLLNSIHVYDTGSTDATTSVARAAGCHVVEGAWHDDFARARNSALGLCRARWALCIDADERIVADPGALGSALQRNTDADVLNASFVHVDPQDRPIGRSAYVKFLRTGAVRFVGRVHEVPMRVDAADVHAMDLDESQVYFRHLGYATPEVRRYKAERNASLARVDAASAQESGDQQRVAESHFHLGRSLLTIELDEEAVGVLHMAWAAFPPVSLGRERVLATLVPVLLQRGEVEAALGLVRANVSEGGSSIHNRLLVAKIALAWGRADEAIDVLSQIPAEGDAAHEVAPSDVLSLRIEALDCLGRRDEALACSFVMVSQHGELVHVPELLARASDQPAEAIAALLSGAERQMWFPGLLAELRREGGLGEDVARHLANHSDH